MQFFNLMLLVLIMMFTAGSSAWSLERFVDLGDGTVLDVTSQLRWLKNANCIATLGGIMKHSESLTWYDAQTWSRNVVSGTCGLSDGSVAGDWRQPTKEELQTLSSISSSNPSETLNATGFFNNSVSAFYYWTSSSDPDNADNAFSVWMGAYPFMHSASKSAIGAVWPVRSGLWVLSAVSVAPAAKDFGSETTGTTSASQVFTISNNGAAGVLSVSSIMVTGGDSGMFVLDKGDGTNGTCGGAHTLASGASCTVSVAFSPTSSGTKSTTLRIVSNDASMTNKDVSLSGTGVSPPVSWWKGENDATDSAGSNNGTTNNTITATAAENQTATASCGTGSTITSFTSVYGADPYWVNCGSCEIGSSSCSVAYNNIACGDPYLNQAKQGKLAIVCGTMFAPGKLGQAFSFDGTGQYVAIPTSSTLDIFGTHSVAFWVKPAANPATGKWFYLVNKWTNALEDKQVSILSDGKVHYALFGTSAGSGVTSATALQTGVWTHVVATYDGADMKIYLNGVLDASAAASGDVWDGTGPLCLGYNPLRASEGFEEPFTGQLDEVKWYNRTLSQEEITAFSDATPDSSTFPPQLDRPLSSLIESAAITVSGLTLDAPVSVSGGEYAISTDNGSSWGSWTDAPGMVSPNNRVKLRLTSAGTRDTRTTATLTIGGVNSTFTVTTVRFIDLGDGTVLDSSSHLRWLKKANCTSAIGGVSKTYGMLNWTDATTWSSNLASLACGLSDGSVAGDWRLPSKDELLGLLAVPDNYRDTSLETAGFDAVVQSLAYWSSDTDPDNVDYARQVDMHSAGTGSGLKTGSRYVWPVRNGQWLYAALAVSPANTNFGSIANNSTSAPQTLTIANSGTSGDLVVSAIAIMYDYFGNMVTLDKGDGTNGSCGATPILAPGASCTVSVTCTPSGGYTGYVDAKLRIKSNDTASPDKYIDLIWTSVQVSTLTVTVSSDGAGSGGTVTSNPQGTNPAGISCTSGSCTTTYNTSPIVTLIQVPNAASVFTDWSGDCSGSGDCSVNMAADKVVTALFKLAPVAKNQTSSLTYTSLATALAEAHENNEIRLLGIQQDGAVTLNQSLILKGGWYGTYLATSGLPTVLNGNLTVQSGESSLESTDVKGVLTIRGGMLRVNDVTVLP